MAKCMPAATTTVAYPWEPAVVAASSNAPLDRDAQSNKIRTRELEIESGCS